MPGIILVNPHSGTDSVGLAEVQECFPEHVVEECSPDGLAARVRQAVSGDVDFVGVAGGDGTIRAAAGELVGTGVALLVIPAGTRNHFAKQLEIDDVDTARAAAMGDHRRSVDIGVVNGVCFVNNSSLGLYPRIVVSREAKQHRLPKLVANVVALFEQLRRGRRLRVNIDGEQFWAWMVFIGNGRYGEGLLDLTDRESLDDHVLDVRVVRADHPFARVRVVLSLLLGRIARSPLVERRTAARLRLDVDRRVVEVAVDGEVERFRPPLQYEVRPAALVVLVPPP